MAFSSGNTVKSRNKKALSEKMNLVVKKTLTYILLILVAIIMLGPFLWLFSTALKSQGENIFAYPPKLIPEHLTLRNFVDVMNSFPFWRYLFNSTLVSVLTVVLNVLFCSLAAYPLARMKFKGRNIIFALVISTMIIPFQLLMIPIYSLALHLGLQNTYAGIILPHITTAFGVFIMRQGMLTVPFELDESAWMDGANSFQVWRKIIMPSVRPSMITLAIFTFVSSWDDFLWPLIIVDDQNMYTLPLGVNMLTGTFASDWKLIAAGSIISIIPIMIVFVFLQRYFVSGLKGAVKG